MPTNKLDPNAELLLLDMQATKSFGEVVVQFKGGKVTLLKRTDVIKPSQPEAPGDGEDRDE